MNVLRIALDIARAICIKFEGLRRAPYLCPANVPTIGYGSTFYEDGTPVKLSDPAIPSDRAERLLDSTLSTIYLPGVLRASPTLINHPRALGALTSFAYNLGVPRYRASTLKKKVDAGDWEGAREEIKKWRKAGGVVLKGLVLRREKEAEYLGD